MAASVRIEDEVFGDMRYVHLGQLLGTTNYDAIGRMAALWRQCTQEQVYVLPEAVVRVVADPDLIVEARLAERVEGGLRIRGTKGRIEWLGKLRKNSKKGGAARKAKGKPNGYPSGYPSGYGAGKPIESPPAPAPAPAPAQISEPRDVVSEEPQPRLSLVPDPPKARRPDKGWTPKLWEARFAALPVLKRLGDRNGVKYEGAKAHVRLVSRLLDDGYTERDMLMVLAYVWDETGLGWSTSRNGQGVEMRRWYKPETLFGPDGFLRYIDEARAWYAKHFPEEVSA